MADRELSAIRELRVHQAGVGKVYFVKPVGVDAAVEAQLEKELNFNQADGSEAVHDTIASALTAAVSGRGDVIYLLPGQYDETVAVTKSVKIVGLGGRGAAYIEPETAGAEGMLITVDDVTLENVGVAGASGADYALKVGSTTVSPDRFRAYGCKFEGPTGSVVVLQGAGDVLLDDCEFCWGGSGLLFDNNDDGFATQVRVRGCKFHNLTAVGIGNDTDGGVTNLEVSNCVFDNADDGTAPTDYIKVDRAGDTGVVSNNSFGIATNASADLKVAAGVLWVANRTEAGVTTARPS